MSVEIVNDALKYYDSNNERYNSIRKKIRYVKHAPMEKTDVEGIKLIFYDESKKEIFTSRVEILGKYYNSINAWVWGWSLPTINKSLTNIIVRYNLFDGHSGEGGMTGIIVANNADNIGAKVYGNVFNAVVVGNGIITGTSAGNLNNAEVYNNTFINCFVATNTPLSGPGSGNVAYNNIFHNMSASMNTFTHNYNYFISATGAPSEANRQVSTTNPFVNSSGGNFHLTGATAAGTSLLPPYNGDVDGSVRGSDGVWDRGAYEFGTDAQPPATPKNLHVK